MRREIDSLRTNQQTQADQLAALTTQVLVLSNRDPAPAQVVPAADLIPAPPAPAVREPHLAAPALFDGTFSLCREFLMQCEYVFELQPSMYSTASARIAYIANLTTGRARRWVMAGREGGVPYMQDYLAFVTELRMVFDHDVHGQDAPAALAALQQGSDSVADYAIEFRILAARCGWNESALYSAFRRGLGETTKDALSGREAPDDLNGLIFQAITLDERTRERRRERAHPQGSAANPPVRPPPPVQYRSVPVVAGPSDAPGEERMQLGRTRTGRITAAEHAHRRREGLCMFCASPAHTVANCPAATGRPSRQAPPPKD